jgi:tripartite-type tricarboxylate transporter receptor subunit TctC
MIWCRLRSTPNRLRCCSFTQCASQIAARELIECAKASNPALEWSSPGMGSPHHLTMELLKKHFDVDLVHIPYRSSTHAMTDMIAGHLKIGFGEVAASLPSVQAGQLRVLAVSTSERLPRCRTHPLLRRRSTCRDSRRFRGTWRSRHAGTFAAIVEILHKEMLRITSLPLLQRQIADLGLVPVITPPVARLSCGRTEKMGRCRA